jgi:hypothetical protein
VKKKHFPAKTRVFDMKQAELSVQEGFTLPAILQVKFKGGILGTEGRMLKRLYPLFSG